MTMMEVTSIKPFLPQTFRLPGRLGKKVMALDLEAIKFKLVKEKGWSLQQADATEPHYKAYIFLLATRPEVNWVPSLAVDEMWHAHILDTQKYMADCARLFGRYIHHYPYLGMKDEGDAAVLADLYQQTKAEALASFGLSLEPGLSLADCGGGGCSSGSSCSSSSSCSTAPASCSTRSSCSTPVIIPSCSSGGGTTDSPRRPFDDRARKPGLTPTPASPRHKKTPWWKPGWLSSVDPEQFAAQYRPTRAELMNSLMGEVKGNA